jgi:hypothetical protein
MLEPSTVPMRCVHRISDAKKTRPEANEPAISSQASASSVPRAVASDPDRRSAARSGRRKGRDEHDRGHGEAQPERAAHAEHGHDRVRREQRREAGARQVDLVGPDPAPATRCVVTVDDVRDERKGRAHQRGAGQDEHAAEEKPREELRGGIGEPSLQRREHLEHRMEPVGEGDA